MKLVIVVVLALICVQQYCAKTCRMCPLVNCLRITHSDCKDNEIFVPRDGYCNCCDSCLGKTAQRAVRSAEHDCAPDLCSRVRCANANRESCEERTHDFKKADGICRCCDLCVPKQGFVSGVY